MSRQIQRQLPHYHLKSGQAEVTVLHPIYRQVRRKIVNIATLLLHQLQGQ